MEYLKPMLGALNVNCPVLTILQENRWLWVMGGSVATVSFCFRCLYCSMLFEVLYFLQLVFVISVNFFLFFFIFDIHFVSLGKRFICSRSSNRPAVLLLLFIYFVNFRSILSLFFYSFSFTFSCRASGEK